ncbi:phage integrase N-terminal SAM-like domain-containing protein [Thiomicrorhabdus aquaedulcis]|uniref:phage integrase N-terminal SAM-like domain-containing protein n=1 Tax=Thiomicrorhabdus aquaedulcis TaxID=2211106 RepID=UPI0022B29788|nr:phage integrase N-terminal SAM-like domain-containing protein [Thiomicrorhabdus aquaedulcis]
MDNTLKKPSLLEDMRNQLRREGYAYSTENSYCDWVRRFVKFHGFLSREAMLSEASVRVEAFLTHLAVKQNVAPSTQNQALNALVYCYSKVLNAPFSDVKASRSRKEPRIPVVLTKEEVGQVLSLMEGTTGLITKLLYAGGLRITEAVRLRVQDIDFGFRQITVRDGKGKKDRVTPLATNLIALLEVQLQKVKTLHQQDLEQGYGSVYLPYALAKNILMRTGNGVGSMCFRAVVWR